MENTAYRGYCEPNRPREEATFFFPIGVYRNVEEENVELAKARTSTFRLRHSTFKSRVPTLDCPNTEFSIPVTYGT